MSKNEIKTANQALYLAARGTTSQVAAFEDRCGRALSTIIDECWDNAERVGNKALALKLETAYSRLTAS